MKTLRRFITSEISQSILEFALVTPFLLLLLVGGVDIARLAQFEIVVGNSARAGVQYGAQNLVTAADTAGMVLAAQQDAAGIPSLSATASYYCACTDGTTATCTAAAACSANHRILYVQVTSSATFSFLINYHIFPTVKAVSRKAILQVVQ